MQDLEQAIQESLKIINNQAGVPDAVWMSETNYWHLLYISGKCRYVPRIKGVKRKRKQKIK